MDNRGLRIRRAILTALREVPHGILLPDDLLRIEAARLAMPRPTNAELSEQIGNADAASQITGIVGDDGLKWRLADAGRAWLAEHP